ncbi:MAG: cyclic pyranopterin monophosphate synthase MoaC [Spirochaetota bacterium]
MLFHCNFFARHGCRRCPTVLTCVAAFDTIFKGIASCEDFQSSPDAAGGSDGQFSHITSDGKAAMVDVSSKPKVRRTAKALGKIFLKESTVKMIQANLIQKGDVLAAAKLAGILGAKKTWELIPLCHNIEIEHIEIHFTVLDSSIEIQSSAVCTDKTGIEMEALTAVSIAALTIYDMCKAVDSTMKISEIHLIEKTKQEIS